MGNVNEKSLLGRKVVVGILIYNFWEMLPALLDSIKTMKHNISIVLLDNNSNENRFREIRAISNKNIEYLRSDKNIGYCAGNNEIIKYAINRLGANYILLFNSDVILDDHCVDALIEAFEENKRNNIGLIGPITYSLSNDGNEKTDKLQSFGIKLYKDRNICNDSIGIDSKTSIGNEILKEVDVVQGTGLGFSADIIDEIGGFDPNYFCYSEEIDLAIRIKKAGYKCYVTQNAKIWHRISSVDDSTISGFACKMIFRNRMLNIKKHKELRCVKSLKYIMVSSLLSILKSIYTMQFAKAYLKVIGMLNGMFHIRRLKLNSNVYVMDNKSSKFQ